MSNTKNCLACPHPISSEELLICPLCRGAYHYTCMGIPPDYYKTIIKDIESSGWRCQSCNNVSSKRRRGDDTPVRTHFERSPPSTTDNDMSICDESSQAEPDYSRMNHSYLDENTSEKANLSMELSLEALSRLLDVKLAGVKNEIRGLDSKLSTTRDQIFRQINQEMTIAITRIKKEFTDTTDQLNNRINAIQTDVMLMNDKIKTLESENTRLTEELFASKNKSIQQPNNAELTTVIDEIRQELNERDQALLLNDLEITGIPEHPGESTIHIVQAISSKLGMSLEDREVVSVERVGPQRPAVAGTTGTSTGLHPRPLVLRLARRSSRDSLLRNARVRRGLDTSAIGLPEHNPRRVYINERLTKNNRKLFWQARQASGAAGWRFVWTKDGCIYAKKTDGKDSKTVRIRHESDIRQVFGVEPITSTEK